MFLRDGNMIDNVIETINKYNMISRGDRIIVGVSGGPDSISLLHILHCISGEFSIYIHAAHLNHMLRGREADLDTEYVKSFCERMGIPCSVKYADINRLSNETGLSIEEAGRKARYDFFSGLAGEIGATKIALAHNMNDQAETILMRLMRGAGIDGLCGIKPVRDGIYIRPLIETPRSEIEKYCRENKLSPRIDSTNLEPVYTRNRIRLKLIPYIKENFNSRIEYSLSLMSRLLNEDNDFLNEYVNNIYGTIAGKDKGKVLIDVGLLKPYPVSIKKRIIRKAISEVRGDLVGIENKHVELSLSIAEGGLTGAAVELPGGIKAVKSYNFLEILHCCSESPCRFSYGLHVPGSVNIDETGARLKSKVMESLPEDYKKSGRFIKYFDYDKIESNLTVRCRQEGDYIVPLGMRGRKKIKELFIDNKIPKDERSSIPLVAANSEVIWVIGYNINDNYKITNGTKKILKLEYEQSGGRDNVVG